MTTININNNTNSVTIHNGHGHAHDESSSILPIFSPRVIVDVGAPALIDGGDESRILTNSFGSGTLGSVDYTSGRLSDTGFTLTYFIRAPEGTELIVNQNALPETLLLTLLSNPDFNQAQSIALEPGRVARIFPRLVAVRFTFPSANELEAAFGAEFTGVAFLVTNFGFVRAGSPDAEQGFINYTGNTLNSIRVDVTGLLRPLVRIENSPIQASFQPPPQVRAEITPGPADASAGAGNININATLEYQGSPRSFPLTWQITGGGALVPGANPPTFVLTETNGTFQQTYSVDSFLFSGNNVTVQLRVPNQPANTTLYNLRLLVPVNNFGNGNGSYAVTSSDPDIDTNPALQPADIINTGS